MRPLYLFLKFLLRVTLWIYYPRFRLVNSGRKRFSRTIFLSNHASSFMDPLVIAGTQRPIVFFMTRADIYKGIMKPIFWASHMLPIYRKHDGGDTNELNQQIFKKTTQVLKYKRNLLVFAEGFTDNVFIRRLKPIKKGSIRMGFIALENINWSKKIYLQAVGVNYSDPNILGSDCLISNGNPICLNNYKADYEENPGKTIHSLVQLLEEEMQNQITDIRDKEMTDFHENIMRITRKGMNATDSNKSISLVERWKYSRRLANWFNETAIQENKDLMNLRTRLSAYFTTLEKENIEETPLYKVTSNQYNKTKTASNLTLLLPIIALAIPLTYLPYKLIKSFVEKTFKRSVFWSSAKMMLGSAAMAVYNCSLFLLISKLFHVPFSILLFTGLIFVPILFVIYVYWIKSLSLYKKIRTLEKTDISEIARERDYIVSEIKRLIPVA